MRHNKTRIIFALFAILGIFYVANILLTQSVFGILIDAPAKVSFMILDPPKDECENCFEADKIIKMINSAYNIKYKSNNISYENAFSQKYIKTYGIKNLPAIVVSGDIENEKITSAWSALSGEERSGRIVIENLLPYYDIESGKVKGVVNAVLVKDATCENCFNENEYINILERFGLFIGNTETYDISSMEGKALIKKYAIVKVPAIILSPDAADYAKFISSWVEVGTVEEDGWFMLREVQKINPQYKQI